MRLTELLAEDYNGLMDTTEMDDMAPDPHSEIPAQLDREMAHERRWEVHDGGDELTAPMGSADLFMREAATGR